MIFFIARLSHFGNERARTIFLRTTEDIDEREGTMKLSTIRIKEAVRLLIEKYDIVMINATWHKSRLSY